LERRPLRAAFWIGWELQLRHVLPHVQL